ncbi:MAG: ATP-dependent zinc metalloprotease FtsH [Puniceicoccales bacterium]|jgi:cell division protease FtsH|nr:ATP-dependent zinc metalloprotease FtsH [Puniceicoccales bacterium]
MSQKSDNDPKKPGRKGPQERMNVKLLFIWLGVCLLITALISAGGGGSRGEGIVKSGEVTVSQVLVWARESKIASLSIEQNPEGGSSFYKLSGTLREVHSKTNEVSEKQQFNATGILTAQNIDELRAKLPPARITEKPASTLLSVILINSLPTLLIVGVIVFFAFQIYKGSSKGTMGFIRSRAKQLNREKQKVTFQDVAGCDEAKEDVQEIVEFLRDAKKFQKIGGRIPRGILLVGPPGTGKTLLARAVAGEADVPYFTISGSDFVEMFVGVGAARVRDMFEQARKNAPCIIFIDEIDAVGRQRGAGLGGGHDEREQTLNSLLVEMDGFEGHEGVIIMAATNRPDVLDSALLRPGRFDRQVYVDLPDIHGREEILQVHAKKVKLSSSVELLRVARFTSGFSGADLANLLNEAALLAARKGKNEIELVEIEEARDKISFGRERRRLMDDEDRRTTAYHEAGHAIVQSVVDDGHLPLHKVTIIPRGRALGMAMFLPKKDILGQSKKQLLARVCTAMAGRIGEETVTGDFSNGASSDIKQATAIARHMVCDWGMSELGPVAFGDERDNVFLGREIGRSQNYSDETARRIDEAIREIIVAQYKRAQEILAMHANAHKVVAEALLEYETLDAVHVAEAIKNGVISTPVIYHPMTKRPDADLPSTAGGLPPRAEPPPLAGIPSAA